MSEPVSSDPEELREQIEQTRAELADTVQALAGKADVKGRAKDKAGELTAQAKAQAGHARTLAAQETQVAKQQITRTQAEKPWLFPAAGAIALLGLVAAFILRRRRA
jgi:LPXTG-motif cell wall-anchored protein